MSAMKLGSEKPGTEKPRSEVAAWAVAHEVSFDVGPLVERFGGGLRQVGFTITFYVRLPAGLPGPARRAAVAEIHEGLREIMRALEPPEGSKARLQVDPPRAAVVLEAEGRGHPEVVLGARVFHRDDYFQEATADEEKALHAAARRLREMGLRERPRPTR
jgi:hypothetical protein